MSEFSTRVTVDCDEIHHLAPLPHRSEGGAKAQPRAARSPARPAPPPLRAHVQHVGRSRTAGGPDCVDGLCEHCGR
eukprot:586738-Prymnesium_polylepis.1